MGGKTSGRGETGQDKNRSASDEAQTANPYFGEYAPVGLVILDRKGHIHKLNRLATDMLGEKSENLLYRSFDTLVEPVYKRIWQQCFSEVIRHNDRKACELMLTNGGESPLPVRADCRQVSDDGETPLRVALVDLSVPLISGHPLPESMDLYRSIFENIADIYYRTDADGRIELISPSCLPQTGYSREELIGRPVTDFYANPAERNDLIGKLQHDGQVNDYEIALVHRDGSQRIASATSHLLYGEDGKPAGVEGILRDVSARKQAQEKLALSEKRYRMLFELIADYALVLEDNGDHPPIIIDANQAALDKHDYTAEELFGKPITLIAQATEEMVKDRLQKIRTGEAIAFESMHRCKNGYTFPAEVIVRRTEIGNRTITFAIGRDISARKETERLQSSLLAENRKLVRRLMEVQEEEKRTLARELHDELGQLLTVINARSEYIQRHTENQELGSASTDIRNATQMLFDACEAARTGLRPASLDSLGLSDALGELTNQWKKSGMDCSLRIEGDPNSLDDLYAISIYRIVQEGLTNAHRHGEASHVEIIIKHVPPRDRKEGLVMIEISDNGKGLHVPTMHRGMGIVGMRERVVALGGNFHFTGIPGDGVRIEATLPLGRRTKEQ